MSSATRVTKPVPVWQGIDFKERINIDRSLLMAVVIIASLGWLMVTSASMDWSQRNFGNIFYVSIRHGIFLCLGTVVAWLVIRIPLSLWRTFSALLVVIALALLVLVLIPGVGREINGSIRWLSLGFMNAQPSEFAKLATILYMASYLDRRRDEVQSKWSGFIKPLFVLSLLAVLLLLEPDFGAVVVLMLATLGLLFLGGVKAGQFILTTVVVLSASVVILLSSPYRLKRLTGYWQPWTEENVYGSGYQLTQSLIAFGRGEFSGVGLGNSIQKLFYLPEAHTDFVFAIWAEEMGLLGSAVILGLFVFIFLRSMKLGRRAFQANQFFAAYIAYGLALLIGFQAFINLGVNVGLLPTKGLTLPFVSYGGSSLLICFISLGLLLRVHHEMEAVDVKK
jgi:cell division protein FtsW